MITWKEHYWYSVPVTRARIEEIIRRAQGALTVLDVGSSEGFVSQALKEAGCYVTSIDINDEAINKAKELFNIDTIKADVMALPFRDNMFDLVVGGEILEHLANPGKGLAEMFRVSKDRVIITLPIGEYWLGCEDHKWQIGCTVIEHDEGKRDELIKKCIVLEFLKRPL